MDSSEPSTHVPTQEALSLEGSHATLAAKLARSVTVLCRYQIP